MRPFTWALTLHSSDARALRGLRLQPGFEVCVQGDVAWLRGPEVADDVSGALRCLPALARFHCDSTLALIPEGARLPIGALPDGPWVPLLQFMPFDPQAARTCPAVPPRVRLTLVPATAEREATLLSTSLQAWQAWASRAPAVRLAPLSFAASSDDRVLIRGLPLPPLPGRRLYEQAGVAVPCGQTWSPAVEAEVVSERFDLLPGELVLLGDESCDVLCASDFVPASRSAVRATSEERAGG